MNFGFAYGPDWYIEFHIFLSYGVLCKYAGGSFELGGRWRKETLQYLNATGTPQFTAPTHPVLYPPGNTRLAVADSSFLDWVSFLRPRVLKLGSPLQHQGATRWPCRKLKNIRTTTKSLRCSRLLAITWSYRYMPAYRVRDTERVQQYYER